MTVAKKPSSPKRRTKATAEGLALTQERLREVIDYDPATGVFKWRYSRGGVRPGICGRVNSHGYHEICVDKKLYRSNRLAFLYMTGRLPERMADHENRDKTDNSWANLREASPTQNSVNVPIKRNNTSGFVGVVWDNDRSKWRAQIRLDGKKTNLGRFDCVDEAIHAHDTAALIAFGEFAHLNWPRDFYAAI